MGGGVKAFIFAKAERNGRIHAKTFANIINYYSLILLTMRKTLLHFCTLLVAFVAWGATACAANQLTVTYLAANKAEVTRASSSDPFMVPVDVSFLNLTTEPLTMQVGIGYYDADDRLVLSTPLVTQTFEPNMGFGQDGMTVPLGQGLADGTYQVKLVNRVGETMPWMPMDRSEQYYLEMEIAGTTARLTNHAPGDETETYHLDIDFSHMNCSGDAATGYEAIGKELTGTLMVTNESAGDYDGDIVITLYRQQEGGADQEEVSTHTEPVSIKAGETAEVDLPVWNLESALDYLYTLEVSYHVSDTRVDQVSYGPIRLIPYRLAVVDCVVENSTALENGGYDVTDDKIKGVMTIANQTRQDYADRLRIILDGPSPSNVDLDLVEIKAGEVIEVPFEFSDLEGGLYTLTLGFNNEEPGVLDGFIAVDLYMLTGTSGIESVEAEGDGQDQPIYNLQGVRMPDGASLPKGIYIKGGKKIVVK